MSPRDKVVLVTGAGRGTGRALALELGRAGAQVIAIDINPDAAQRTADAILQAAGRAEAQSVDVSNKMATQTMLYDVLERYPQIDGLVNAAEITPGNTALKMDEGEWDRTLDVNLKGVFVISQTVARAMIAARDTGAAGGGVIVIVIRDSHTSHAAIRAAREGLRGLAAALAEEWQPQGLRVCAAHSSEAAMSCLTDN
jgi:NAD(P)-dependent dehydrogenase (short-subunit alcohol dehydrogenase family)